MKYTKNQADLSLSGPEQIWASFDPRHVVSLGEASSVIGLSYSRAYRREKEGTLGLPVRKNELGQLFVRVEDLVNYLYPKVPSDSNPEPLSGKNKNKKGKLKTTGVS